MRLRDSQSDVSVSLVAPATLLARMQPPLAEGSEILVLAAVEFWNKRGELHVKARQIRALGLGELLARLEQLRSLLAAEGVFDRERKRELPFLPRRVGLICGRNSDAERDVTRVASRRWPGIEFEIREVAVQGTSAVSAVTAALSELDHQPDVDVIIITRGGGSVEDLLPFSNEALIRAVASATTPVVSAIGHERDRPLLDDVADVRAATPTDAAHRVVPDWQEEVDRVRASRAQLRRLLHQRLESEARSIAMLRRSGTLQAARGQLDHEAAGLERTRAEALRALNHRLDHATAATASLRQRLHALSPAATLDRGYAIATDSAGIIITDPAEVDLGDDFTVRVRGGSFAGRRIDPEDERPLRRPPTGTAPPAPTHPSATNEGSTSP